jgi:hypothetical protein
MIFGRYLTLFFAPLRITLRNSARTGFFFISRRFPQIEIPQIFADNAFAYRIICPKNIAFMNTLFVPYQYALKFVLS